MFEFVDLKVLLAIQSNAIVSSYLNSVPTMYNISWKMIFSQYLSLELLSLFVCLWFELIMLKTFYDFHHNVQRNCFLFGTLNEIKRTLIPSPAIICNGQFLFSAAVSTVILYVIKKILSRCPMYLFTIKLYRVLAVGMPVLHLTDCIILWEGLQSLCRSMVSTTECSSDALLGIDFRTFHPKYMRGWKLYGAVKKCLIYQALATLFWLAFVLSHRYRYRLGKSKVKGDEINANYSLTNGVSHRPHARNGSAKVLDV